MFGREAWLLLDAHLERALDTPDDVEARGAMLLGAHLAGLAIESSMLGAAHACANPLTSRYEIAHGAAVLLMLPHVMRFNESSVGALYADLARHRAAGNGAPLVERVVELRRTAGLPERLQDSQVQRASLPALAKAAAEQWTAEFNPRTVTEQDLLEIYEAAW